MRYNFDKGNKYPFIVRLVEKVFSISDELEVYRIFDKYVETYIGIYNRKKINKILGVISFVCVKRFDNEDSILILKAKWNRKYKKLKVTLVKRILVSLN
ncbi:MAG: hypothetical protein N2712_00735 [Brevinematales bacterium]|nr:hypothetical protein [Brevinematales bacterium]